MAAVRGEPYVLRVGHRFYDWDQLAVASSDGSEAFAAGEEDWRPINPAELTFDARALSEAEVRAFWHKTLERVGDPPFTDRTPAASSPHDSWTDQAIAAMRRARALNDNNRPDPTE